MDTTARVAVALAGWRRKGHYIGDDRRGSLMHAPLSATYLLTFLVLLAVVWLVVEVSVVAGAHLPESINARGLDSLLSATTAVLGAVLCILAFVRWRLIGDARALWLGVAGLALGPLAAGVGDLGRAVVQDAPAALAPLQLAGGVTAVGAFAAAAFWAPVDTRLRPGVVTAAAAALVAALTLALVATPLAVVVENPATRIVLAGAWVAAAVGHTRRRAGRAGAGALAVAGAALAFGESLYASIPAATDPSMALASGALLQLFGLTLLLSHSLRDLAIAFSTQRARLFATEVSMEAVQAKRQAEQEDLEERAHDAKNALLAIEGATLTLERHRDRLAPEQREQLAQAVTHEISRLQRLVESRPGQDDQVPFNVIELVNPIVATERAAGVVVQLDVPGDLVAFGRPSETAEVLHNLFDNARRYAPGSPITVRAARDGEWAAIYVEDRGRGIERSERETIFQRGRRGAASHATEGSGLGLFVARRLMIEQEGDLWVETRKGGGASFGLCLRLAVGDENSVEESLDENERAVEESAEETTVKEELDTAVEREEALR